MAHSDFSISITDKAVDVRCTPSVSDPRGKLFGFIFIIIAIVVVACAVLFLPGKHGNPSICGMIWPVLLRIRPGFWYPSLDLCFS